MGSSATYTQLRSGDWGIRVPGVAKEKQEIVVTKKDGTTKTETVARVLWSGRDSKSGQTMSLCAIARSASRSGGGHEDEVRCRHCNAWTAEGDDWCMVCGRADYER